MRRSLRPTRATWVHPEWKDPANDSQPYCNIETTSWQNFGPLEDNEVVAMFVCRSSSWVPPHYDNLYTQFVAMLSDKYYPKILQSVSPREDLDYAALNTARRKLRASLNQGNANPPDAVK